MGVDNIINNNEGNYHNIMHPDTRKGRGANIALFIIFLLILLPLNGYAIYSTFGEVVYTGIKNPGIPLQILTQNYSSGIYYISFHRQGKREVLKLIKL